MSILCQGEVDTCFILEMRSVFHVLTDQRVTFLNVLELRFFFLRQSSPSHEYSDTDCLFLFCLSTRNNRTADLQESASHPTAYVTSQFQMVVATIDTGPGFQCHG